MGVPETILKVTSEIERLPFTVKADFRTTYPYGLFAVPLKDVIRLHASSGTTGKQVVGGHTQADMTMWGEVMARTFAAGGVTAEDLRQVLGLHAHVLIVEPHHLPRSEGKVKRVVDRRQLFG